MNLKPCLFCPHPEHINITNGNVISNGWSTGDVAIYSCNIGYYLVGPESRKCLTDGSWSLTEPFCTEIHCELPPILDNGNLINTGTEYGKTTTYSCNTGFKLTGANITTCKFDGHWDNPAPTCSILDSGQATAGHEGIFCNNDELRKIFNATCSNMDCGQLTAPINGTVTMNSTKYEGIASFACDTGFYMSGSNTTSCNASGNWDTTTPSCFPIDCGDVQHPLNGYVSYTNSTFNETATFSCQIGFVMSGYNITTCDSSGKWNNRPPNCSMINCGDLHVPENGFMIMSRNTTILGTHATFSCAKGYILIGSASRSCLSNGAWSGFHPVCTEHNGSTSTKPNTVPCACLFQKHWPNLTNDQIIEELVHTLSVDKHNTTLARSRRQCREDNRTSSVAISFVAVGMMCVILAPVVCSDLVKVLRYIKYKAYRHKCRYGIGHCRANESNDLHVNVHNEFVQRAVVVNESAV